MLKIVAFSLIAANVFAASVAFAGRPYTYGHECVKYHGNWVNAPKLDCSPLPMGNSNVIVPTKKKV